MGDDDLMQDVRSKVSDECHQVLVAVSRARQCDIAELMREVLHNWAMARIHEASLIQRITRREDASGSGKGTKGNR